MKTLTIEVTAADIAAGIPEMSFACPIALAAARLTGEPVKVTDDAIRVGRSLYADLPPEAAEFVCNFDDGVEVSPLTFTIADLRGPRS
jgi:hypothetical protein